MSFDPPPETIGDRMRRQRKRLGLEVRELAALAGVGPNTIMRVEGGAVPRDDTLERIARALQAPADWLRTGRMH